MPCQNTGQEINVLVLMNTCVRLHLLCVLHSCLVAIAVKWHGVSVCSSQAFKCSMSQTLMKTNVGFLFHFITENRSHMSELLLLNLSGISACFFIQEAIYLRCSQRCLLSVRKTPSADETHRLM